MSKKWPKFEKSGFTKLKVLKFLSQIILNLPRGAPQPFIASQMLWLSKTTHLLVKIWS